MKEPRAKDWCHFIAQRVCFKLSFVGLWYYILQERYTPLKSTRSYQNDYQSSPRRLAVFRLILVSVNMDETSLNSCMQLFREPCVGDELNIEDT